MRRIFILALFCLLAVPAILFAIENHHLVRLDINPFDFFTNNLVASLELPLSLILGVAFIVGLFLGLLLSFFKN